MLVTNNLLIDSAEHTDLIFFGNERADLIDSLGRPQKGYVCRFGFQGRTLYVPFFDSRGITPATPYVVRGIEVFEGTKSGGLDESLNAGTDAQQLNHVTQGNTNTIVKVYN